MNGGLARWWATIVLQRTEDMTACNVSPGEGLLAIRALVRDYRDAHKGTPPVVASQRSDLMHP
jgi:hypothetical protein